MYNMELNIIYTSKLYIHVYVGLQLNWAISYLGDNKTCPIECMVEIKWGLDNNMCPMECRVETELPRLYMDDNKTCPIECLVGAEGECPPQG